MKVMIIDDEPVVRKGLKKCIDWEKYGFTICGEASDGETGLQNVLSMLPDLVLLDVRMPGMYGHVLAEEARKKGFTGKFIILSGYADFDYAKKAITANVTDYLLKPVDEDQLIAAVCQARDELNQERLISAYGGQNTEESRNILLGNLLEGRIKWEQELFALLCKDKKVSSYQLVHVELLCADINIQKVTKDRIITLCSDLTMDSMDLEGKLYILLYGKYAITEFAGRIETVIAEMQEVLFYFSQVISNTAVLPQLFRDIKRTAENRFFFWRDTPYINCGDSCEKQKSPYSEDFLQLLDLLSNYILTGQNDKMKETLEHIELLIRNHNISEGRAAQILVNCYLQIKKMLVEKEPGYASQTSKDMTVLNELCHQRSLYCMITYLTEQFENMIQTKGITNKSICEKMKDYIVNHYQYSILLEDLAQLLGYNTAYLGKLFKKETGLSFHSYLMAIRMEKAKELLIKNVKVYDAAVQTGFKDLEYFSRKFKEQVGFSPSDYRKK